MFLNDVQHENVSRTLTGIARLASEIQRKLHDKSVNKNRVAIEELRTLVEYALDQLR